MVKLIFSVFLFFHFGASAALVNSVTVSNPQIPVSQSGIWAIDVTDNFLTDAQLRASPLAVNVQNFPATQNVSVTGGSVAVSNFPTGFNVNDGVTTKTLGAQLVSSDISKVTASVIHGVTTGGGGGYVDVKVTPSGALVTDSTVNGTVTVSNNFLTDAQLRATAVPVSGTFWQATQPVSLASVPLASGASTLTEQQSQTSLLGLIETGTDNINAKLPAGLTVVGGKLQVDIPSPLAVTVSGTPSVSVSNFPATQPISAATLPLPTGAAQDRTTAAAPSSIRLSDGTAFYDARQIRALTSADVVTVANPQTSVSVTGSVAVTGPLTDTQLRASAVPVSLASVPTHAVTQSGVWNVGLNAGSNAIGSITNTSFGISGTLPAFAATPTFNVGTIGGIATESTLSALNTKVPSGLTVKAASTAAVATDQALVVAISPNNSLSTTISGTPNVNITNASIPVTGTFFQATQPVSIASSVAVTGPLTDTQLRASAVPVSLASTTISNFPATQPISAASLPLPTGAATSANQNTEITSLQLIDNAIGAVTGTAATASQLIGGIFNTTLPTITSGQQSAIQLDEKGRLLRGVDNGRISYAAATTSAGFTAAATANQDVWRISGSATKTVYIRKIRITATATAVQGNRVSIIKRSAANTAGTPVANTAVPYDSTDVAATASVVHYTAAPTSGAAIGPVRTASYLIPTTTGLYNSERVFEFTENEGNPLTLRGVAQGVGIVFATAPGAGNLISISVEWDEE